MRKILLTAALLASATVMHAQSGSNSASQTVTMTTGNSIELKFTASSSATGNTVTMPFSSVTDYTNGVISADQQISVMSNKNFNVSVKSSSTNFTYAGSATPTPTMPVSGVLGLMVSANSTGGSIASPFSSSSYSTITSANQNFITNGTLGSAQLFSVKYKGTPGFNYPGGSYTVDIVYTATQL